MKGKLLTRHSLNKWGPKPDSKSGSEPVPRKGL